MTRSQIMARMPAPLLICLLVMRSPSAAPVLDGRQTGLAMPPLLADGMVLQRGVPLPGWGTAPAGSDIRVQLGEISRTTTAGAGGSWRVELSPLEAGGPRSLTVSIGGSNMELGGELFRMLVEDWRSAWQPPGLPFRHVQLPNLNRDWMMFREIQLQALRHFAGQAAIDGDTLLVTSNLVPVPVAARYAWAPSPVRNVVNGEGLPASPFRSGEEAFVSTPSRPPGTGFEDLPMGPFAELPDNIGKWTSNGADAEIHDAHRRSNRQCLRILGGEDRTCELVLAPGLRDACRLSFWAERWTRRTPFEFRVEALSDGTWRQVYNGDKDIKVGGFLTHVNVDLQGNIERLRFTCTSPENSGIMIDDLTTGKPTPMTLTSATVHWRQTPVLVGNPLSPVAQIRLITTGNLVPLTVKGLAVNLDGTTDLADIARVAVFHAGPSDALNHRDPKRLFDTLNAFGVAEAAAGTLAVSGTQELQEGENVFWIAVEPADGADLDHRIVATCTSVVFGDDLRIPLVPIGEPIRQRFGVALRNPGDAESKCYRIPGLATTNNGTLIAVYDVRWQGGGDLPGNIDVGMSRSTDGGRTWEPMEVIMDMGNDPKWRYDGIGDPAVLVDRGTNTVWVAATWSHGNRSWNGSGPGMTPGETGQFMLVKSEDDGKTWSEPINITSQIKDPTWCFVLQGPGRGITMQDGALVFPAQYQDPPDKRRLPHSTIIHSRDHGKTWEIGTGAFDDSTESAVAELPDGSLMLSCRYNRQNRRVVVTTRDMGATWTEHPTSRKDVPEPGACQASLISVDRELRKDAGGWLLMSNPNVGDRPRRRITIKASRDDGATWPEAHHVLLDEGNSAGYSCLTMTDDRTVGILYEGSLANMTFQRVPLAEIAGVGTRQTSSGKKGVK